MTEALLVIFLLLVFVNVGLSILRGWKDKKEYFFVYMQDKHQDRYIMVSAIVICAIFILSFIFSKFLITKIVLIFIDLVFGYAMYLDYKKKLKSLLMKYTEKL
jgi:amino acid transporter